MQVGANDDVHGCGLSDLVLMETAVLVRFEDQRADLGQDAKFFVGNRDEVNSFGSESIKSTQGDTTDTNEDEVSEFLSVLQVTIIDQLHDEKHIKEHLAFSDLRNLGGTHTCAMQLILNVLIGLEGSWLARQLESLVKIGKVKLDDKDCVR